MKPRDNLFVVVGSSTGSVSVLVWTFKRFALPKPGASPQTAAVAAMATVPPFVAKPVAILWVMVVLAIPLVCSFMIGIPSHPNVIALLPVGRCNDNSRMDNGGGVSNILDGSIASLVAISTMMDPSTCLVLSGPDWFFI